MDVFFGVGLTWYPWREPDTNFRWNEETAKKLRAEVLSIRPTYDTNLTKFNVLAIGAMGQGKSAMINTFASISIGGKTSVCNSAQSTKNVTMHYRKFQFPGELDNFCIGDVFGFSFTDDIQAPLEDLKLIIKGHIKSGYKFDLARRISEDSEFYIKEPKLSDRIHCVVIVCDSLHAYDLHASMVKNLNLIMKTINFANIPVLVALTKVDLLSVHVKSNINTIYRCRNVRTAVQKAAKKLKISRPNTFPIVNFEEMDTFTWKETIPSLYFIRALLRMAKSHSHNDDDVSH